jgi:malate permease and related proteins
MEVLVTVVPIFVIIIIGWVVRKRGLITPEFLTPANQLVYYFSIPALVFNAIARANFHEQFNVAVLLLTLLAAVIVSFGAFLVTRLKPMAASRSGAFIQGAGHGNLGYFGLPIAFYYLGSGGLARAAIICAFLMILQNFISVLVLVFHDQSNRVSLHPSHLVGKVLGNPAIVGALSGIAVSSLEIPLPAVLARIFDILGGLAPPMALLLIGASISSELMRRYLWTTLGVVFFKLICLPACGLALFTLLGIARADYLPAIILLACPTATVAYVMARQLHGDADFAVAAISVTTLFSSATMLLWLSMLS